MLSRTLFWTEKTEQYYYIPLGHTPTKTKTSQRMSREFFVGRKFLSQEWGKDLEKFVAKDWPVLCEFYKMPQGPRLQPPQRKGMDERGFLDSLNIAIGGRHSRRPATRHPGMYEAFLESGSGISQKSVRHFVAHSCVCQALLEEGLQGNRP